MKKAVCVVLLLLLVLPVISMTAYALDTDDEVLSYDNYFYYDNVDGSKDGGLLTDCLIIEVEKSDFDVLDEIPSSIFGDLSESITDIKYESYDTTAYISIYFDQSNVPVNVFGWKEYSKELIDEYISRYEYAKTLSFAKAVYPNKDGYTTIDPRPKWYDYNNYLYYNNKNFERIKEGLLTSEVEVTVNKAFTEDLTLDASYLPNIADMIEDIVQVDGTLFKIIFKEDLDGVLTEEECGKFAEAIDYIVSKRAYFVDFKLSRRTAPVPDSSPDSGAADTDVNSGGASLHNPQTGDGLFLLVAVALLTAASAVTVFAAVKKKSEK